MAKRRSRLQNSKNSLDDDESMVTSKRRSNEKLISSRLTSKILKQALSQQREIEEEEAGEKHPSSSAFSIAAAEDDQRKGVEEEDIDDFAGFSETQSQFGDDDVDLNDEKLLEAFFSRDAGPQQTLADVIMKKMKEKEENASLDSSLPKLDNSIIKHYKSVGKFLREYTAGKLPKPFKHITAMEAWEDVLYLTEPENWSPNAVYQATRIFASNFSSRKAEQFYKLVLLPRVREDIRKHKRLHFALYQSLKKALYKPAAFNKGILIPLCKSGTCNLREAVIVGSIIQKVSIPMLHSSVALLKLAEMAYFGTTSYFIKLLLEKKYALPYRVLDAVTGHFMRFVDEERVMPVIWHQSLLAFVQRYKHELMKEDKINLRNLLEKQKHKLVTPEILRELDNSRSRGQKEEDLMMTSGSVINMPIEEDRFDIPEVPMEED